MEISQPTKDLIGNIMVLLLMAVVIVWGKKIVDRHYTPKEEDEWPDAM